MNKEKNNTQTWENLLQTYNEAYLQMAIANGDEVCSKTNLFIKVDECPFYNKDVKRFKTFKVVSELTDYDFDYESYQ